MKTPPIVEHLETYLGSITKGWAPGLTVGIQVALFQNTPSSGLATLTSLGLNEHVLQLPKERIVRQEVLLVVDIQSPLERLSALVLRIAEMVLESHKALLRGQVLPLEEPVISGGLLTHLYVCIPYFFGEEAQTMLSSVPPTVLAWLVPITQAEASFIAKNGWNAFEDHLEATGEQLDLFDLKRPSTC